MSAIKFSQKGGQRVTIKMNRIRARIKNPIGLWNSLSRDILKDIQGQFNSKGSTYSTPWAKLSPSTIKQKIAQGMNNGILQRTKELKGSFVIKEKNRFKLVIGSKVEKEKLVWHQLGKGRMKRPVLNVNSSRFISVLRKNIRKFLKKIANA